MSTSSSLAIEPTTRRAGIRGRTIVLEAAAAASLTSGCVALGSPDDPWLTGVGFHPAWIAVLLLAGRYGTRGLFIGLGVTGIVLSGTSLALGGTLFDLARTPSHSDLFALGGAIVVSWIAMLHESRTTRLATQLGDAEHARSTADQTTTALEEVVGLLRTRHDRIDLSLTLWRDLAARLGSGDAMQAATAALELGAIRSGATAGVVSLWDGSALHVLARFGRESAADPRAQRTGRDRTAAMAVEREMPTMATDLAGAAERDSDVAVPLLDPRSETVLGVLAFRGVAPGQLRAVELHDLTVVAQWLAPALSRRAPHMQAPRLRAVEGARR